ncbi:MAG: MFS transporter [Candidatus Didemnitutus sp.]|nr:MFS transporter [Candidatus Didemnitutus sp.]
MTARAAPSPATIYWTAFVGLFFDYYDLYLFVYLERALADEFALTPTQSSWLQFAGLAGVGVGSLIFGFLADRVGRGRAMLATFALYGAGITGISLAWSAGSLLAFRLLASLALGAEWGISHTYLAERVAGATRYRFSAWLQFSILGGLLAAMAARFALPIVGWRALFAASLVPVAGLALWRWRALAEPVVEEKKSPDAARAVWRSQGGAFVVCFAMASLTIASGTMNVFYARELPQSPWFTALFWLNVAPGMAFGAWLVGRVGVTRALWLYAAGLTALSLACWQWTWTGRSLFFALSLPLLNGVPFGLMGAYFNEVFARYRTTLSGAAYNLGRILAGFAPVLIAALGLHEGGRYFLFTAALGLAVAALGFVLPQAAGAKDRAD